MITNHMKSFGTNQVLVFKLTGLKRKYLVPFFLKRKVLKWLNWLKEGIQAWMIKAWILKKAPWWRLEESITLCKKLEYLCFWCWLDGSRFTHTCTRYPLQVLYKNCFQNSYVLTLIADSWTEQSTTFMKGVVNKLVQSCRQGFTDNSVFLCFRAAVDNFFNLLKADMYCISQLSTCLLDSTAKNLVIAYWTVDSPIGLSTALVCYLG